MTCDYNCEIKRINDNPKLYIYEFIDYKDDVYFWPKIVNSYHPKTILEVGIVKET